MKIPVPPESVAIPLAEPLLLGNETAYVLECLQSNRISTSGPMVTRFEHALEERLGARWAVATVSGTAALHVALLAVGVRPGAEVVMPRISFVAPANAVRYCSAWPVFTDIDSAHWQWDLAQVREFLDRGCERTPSGLRNLRSGRPVGALLAVHLLGGLCDLDAMFELAREFGLPVVEDAAQACGARYRGRPIGASAGGRVPSLAIVSFNANKIVTSGGGGAILTNDPALARRCRHLTTVAKLAGPGFVHDEVGFNYRLPSLAAALGLAQLEQLDAFLARKRAIASRYAALLGPVPSIRFRVSPEWEEPNHWLCTVLVDGDAAPVVAALQASGIEARPIWTPLHRLPAFAGCLCAGAAGGFVDRFYRGALSLPSGCGLSDACIQTVAGALVRALAPRETARGCHGLGR
ncbi:MAG: DegT/DnrJ/EryC1/StrS family aminotransferase [Bryobacterales bacterium]|nr:DegT/DnrJ/EryC1/StrS family aminotransferase [Bryobacterales bacterium]